MADLFRVGVSLYLVDRISNDLRRVAMSMRYTSRETELAQAKIASLQRVMARRADYAAATSSFRDYANKWRGHISALEAARKSEQEYLKSNAAAHFGLQTSIEANIANLDKQIDPLKTQSAELQKQMGLRKQAMVAESQKYDQLVKNNQLESQSLALMRQQQDIVTAQRFGRVERMALAGMAGVGIGGMGVHAMEAVLRESAPIAQQLQSFQVLGGISQKQTLGLLGTAQAVAGQAAIFSTGDVLKMAMEIWRTGVPLDTTTRALKDIVFGTELISRLPGAGDPDSIATMLGQQVGQFGIMGATATNRFVAQMLDVIKRTQTSAAAFGTALSQERPIEQAMGWTIPNMLAMAGITQGFGGKGGFSPALLNTFFTTMFTGGTPKAHAAMVAMGLHPGSYKDPMALFQDLENSYSKLGPGKFTALGREAFGGVRGEKVALAFVTSFPAIVQRLDELQKSLANAVPITEQQAKLLDTLQGQAQRLNTNFQSLEITMGMMNDTTLKRFLGHMADLTQQLNNFLITHPKIGGMGADLFASGTVAANVFGYGMIGGAAATAAGWEALGAFLAAIAVYGSGAILVVAGAVALYKVLTMFAGLPTIDKWPGIAGGGAAAVHAAPGTVYDAYGTPVTTTVKGLRSAWGAPMGDPTGGVFGGGPAIHVHGDMHVHVDGKVDPKEFTKAVAESIHKSLYSLGSPGEGVGHEWPLTHADVSP